MVGRVFIARAALCLAAAGVALLLFLDSGSAPDPVKISSIGGEMAGQQVALNARVLSSYQRGSTVFLELYDGSGKIRAVLFRPNPEKLALVGKNKFASFGGKVQVYGGSVELVVEAVEEWA